MLSLPGVNTNCTLLLPIPQQNYLGILARARFELQLDAHHAQVIAQANALDTLMTTTKADTISGQTKMISAANDMRTSLVLPLVE